MLYSVTVPGLEVSCYLLSAAFDSAGGDWCDVVSVDETHVAVVIGDVTGHGAAAAAVMDPLRSLVRVCVGEGCAPQDVLARCSAWLSADEDHHLATMICGCLDLASRELTLANAGHLQPLLLLDGTGEFLCSDVGPPCGTMPGGGYASTTVELPPGATLLAFTDGLVERRRRSIDWSLARLRAIGLACRSRSLETQLEAIVATLLPDASDDAALLGLRLPENGGRDLNSIDARLRGQVVTTSGTDAHAGAARRRSRLGRRDDGRADAAPQADSDESANALRRMSNATGQRSAQGRGARARVGAERRRARARRVGRRWHRDAQG